jgi:hypothetical protein
VAPKDNRTPGYERAAIVLERGERATGVVSSPFGTVPLLHEIAGSRRDGNRARCCVQ